MHKFLITGAAGFIGFHLSKRLLSEGHQVVGLDNLNDYYDVRLKEARLDLIKSHENFTFVKLGLEDRDGINQLFKDHNFDRVVNLAAQAGVRYSLENPHAYVDANIVGFVNILEACRHSKTAHLVYASSSSVYGGNTEMPFSVEQSVDHPLSLYAASKKSNELMAHTYSHLFDLPTTGLRFFTVYGPWGRPDMALFLFTKAILEGKPINVFNNGQMQRDFTYVDDIVEGIVRVAENVPTRNDELKAGDITPANSTAPFKVYNIGNNKPVALMEFIEAIEESIGKVAEKNFMPMQPGDVPATFADASALIRDVGFAPNTPIKEGVSNFVNWYREFYQV